jgi:MFS family permease
MVGASIAAATFRLSGSNYIATFALSAIPAAVALVVVTVAFADEAKTVGAAKKAKRAADKAARSPDDLQLTLPQKAKAFAGVLKPAYWQALIVVCVLYFARFDWSFVILRAKQVMPKSQLAGLMMCTMLVQTVAAPPLSRIAKTSVRTRNRMLLAGLAPMIAANAIFATASSAAGMAAGALLVGLHMAATHGITLGMMSSAIPAGTVPGLGRVSGTAWSFTDLVLGFALAYSNRFAGQLSDITVQRGMGNVGCFYGGGGAALLAALLIILFRLFGRSEERRVRQHCKRPGR